jgi:hypothetical protein
MAATVFSPLAGVSPYASTRSHQAFNALSTAQKGGDLVAHLNTL